MKFRVIVIAVVLASVAAQEIPFGEFESSSVSEYVPAEVRREKRSLTTICVEIKPSSPHEEPYFMCKGTDMPQFSKGGSYGGGQSSGYSKPSYKPKPSESYAESDSYHPGGKGDYHGPVKTYKPAGYGSDYSAPSKPSYDKKPAYSDHGSHSAYSSYDAPKPSYGAKPYATHDSPSDYSKPAAHKYEKPSSHYEPTYSSKPQPYSHGSASEYSKPSSYDSKPSYTEGSYSKPTYDQYSPPASKPSSYSANPSSYDHSDYASYGPSKPSYSDPAKPYTKATPDPTSYSKPTYSPSEYSKPVKQYASSEKGYGQDSSKPVYSPPPQAYRALNDDMMQPMWDARPQDESFGYRSMDTPMEYYNHEPPRVGDPEQQQQPQFTALDAPVKMDFSPNERDAPTLQAAYPYTPSYSPAPTYAPATPTYTSAAPTYAPSYAAAAPSYAPATPTYAPIYAPAAPSYSTPIQSYINPSPVYKPSCPQSYLYSLQPAIISLPCFSSQPGYGQTAYSQPLGSPAIIGGPHQFYPSNVNPLQDLGTSRSDGNSESAKTIEDDSSSIESKENDKKSDPENENSQANPKKSDVIKSKDEKLAEMKIQNPEVGAETPKEHQSSLPVGSSGTDGSDTKAALHALQRMSQIAAQLNKEDSNQGGDAVAGSDKSTGH